MGVAALSNRLPLSWRVEKDGLGYQWESGYHIWKHWNNTGELFDLFDCNIHFPWGYLVDYSLGLAMFLDGKIGYYLFNTNNRVLVMGICMWWHWKCPKHFQRSIFKITRIEHFHIFFHFMFWYDDARKQKAFIHLMKDTPDMICCNNIVAVVVYFLGHHGLI